MSSNTITETHLEPIYKGGVTAFAEDFKHRKVSSEELTRQYLERIKNTDEQLGAFEYINYDAAIESAKAMDTLRDSGVYLGPLMGVPIAVKDVFLIDGMPYPKVGSNMELPDILGKEEGSFIKALKSAGCVILGTTKTVEFCLGITGVSEPRGTPWCSSDLQNKRFPGGSSSGSGVAVGANLCMFAIGSDSGGSVRVPAAFNGVFGLKTTFGLWPTDGAFPLDKTVDSIGLITQTARDARLIFNTLSTKLNPSFSVKNNTEIDFKQIKLGLPSNHFSDGLSATVEKAFTQANNALESVGVNFETLHLPGAEERKDYFPVTMPTYLLAILGTDRFLANKDKMDQVIATRIESGLNVEAYKYLALIEKREKSITAAHKAMKPFDAIVSPTTTIQPPLVTDAEDPVKGLSLALGMTQNTQPANYLDLCAVSLPIPCNDLPIGYQLNAGPNNDSNLLNLAVAIENLFEQKSDLLKT